LESASIALTMLSLLMVPLILAMAAIATLSSAQENSD